MSEDHGNDVTIGTIKSSRVIAASVTTGRERLGTVDDFVAGLSDFDRRARVCLADPGTDIGTPLYLDYVTAQVMAWTKDELDLLSRVTGEIGTLLAGRWPQLLPPEVHLVKTTGQEESRAAYTRGTDTVVLPAGKITPALGPSPGGDALFPRSNTTGLRDILLHELFHLISKNSPERRKALYRLVGYTQFGPAVLLPDVPWPAAGCAATLPDLRITNPDAPGLDVYITLPVPRARHEAAPAAGGTRDLVERPLLPLLAADRPYGGGNFFAYLTWSFLELKQDGTGGWVVDTTPDGRPVVHPMVPGSALWQSYLDRVGRNVRGELFHPDEICASNFVHAALLPSAALLTSMDHVLAGSGR